MTFMANHLCCWGSLLEQYLTSWGKLFLFQSIHNPPVMDLDVFPL